MKVSILIPWALAAAGFLSAGALLAGRSSTSVPIAGSDGERHGPRDPGLGDHTPIAHHRRAVPPRNPTTRTPPRNDPPAEEPEPARPAGPAPCYLPATATAELHLEEFHIETPPGDRLLVGRASFVRTSPAPIETVWSGAFSVQAPYPQNTNGVEPLAPWMLASSSTEAPAPVPVEPTDDEPARPDPCPHWSLEAKFGWANHGHAYSVVGGARISKHVWGTLGFTSVSTRPNNGAVLVGARYEW